MKLVVNILDNELWSSKATINFSKKISHVVKLRLSTNSNGSTTRFYPRTTTIPIYINDLPDNLNSLVKLFADNTSLFSTVHDPTLSAKILNDDLSRISEWAHRWKMLFNPGITKQAQEIIFKKKFQKWPPYCLFQWSPSCTYYLSKTFRYAFRWKIEFQSSCERKNC